MRSLGPLEFQELHQLHTFRGPNLFISLGEILLPNPSLDPGLQEEIWAILWKKVLEAHREQRPEEPGIPCAVTPGMGLFRHALPGAVLPFLILSGNWLSAENINFHNIRPPLDPTPFPNSFKCFTCDNAVDNYNCNRWAEDRWCPERMVGEGKKQRNEETNQERAAKRRELKREV
ncbi:hypothetical protein TURU_135739 [Turdus rufiventris]|nr:hypothetical protein TURU_135739 [Turdus rufiventris]